MNDNMEFGEMQDLFAGDGYTIKDIGEAESVKSWLDSKVMIPLEMYSDALKEIAAAEKTNEVMTKLDHKERRSGSCVALDGIVVYGWMQYTKKWHSEKGRTVDGCIQISTAYIQNALPWGNRRIKTAIDYLIKRKYLCKAIEYVRNAETGEIVTKRSWYGVSS